MNTKIETEHIASKLNSYCSDFSNHSFFLCAQKHTIPLSILHEFAFYQYSDSICWIPMLALMKSKAVKSSRLQRAIEENIQHEAGVGGTSHVELAKNLMRSLGILNVDGFKSDTFSRSASLWLSDDFDRFAEPEVAGWLLTAETLVPLMFGKMIESYKKLECDVSYFSEHISVDGDEHSQWMMESVREVLSIYGRDAEKQILEGMEDARQETWEVPNALYGKMVGGQL